MAVVSPKQQQAAAIPAVADSAWKQLSAVRSDFFGYLQSAAAHGPLVWLRPAPGMRILLVNDPDHIHQILVSDASAYSKSAMTRRMVGKFLGQGLVLSEGERHRRERALVQPAFRPTSVARFLPILGLTTRSRLRKWPADKPIEVHSEMAALSLSCLLLSLFDMHDGEDAFGVQSAMRQFATSIGSRFERIPLPDWLPTPGNLRDRRAIRTVARSLDAVLDSRRHLSPGSDLVSRLIDARDHQGHLDHRQLREHLMTLYFAGHETSAQALSWAIALLARHPLLQEKLHKELSTFGDSGPGADSLLQLPELDSFVRELLRLYPPAWLFDRETVRQTELGGYTLAPKTVLYISPWLMHRSPALYSNPLQFDPGRPPPADRRYYLPFGAGARRCVGEHFALAIIKVALAQILMYAEVLEDDSPLPAFKAGATLSAQSPLSVRIRPRKRAA